MDRYDEDGHLKDSAHRDDHFFIGQMKEKHSKTQEIKEKIKASVISSILIAMTIGLAGFIWDVVTMYIKGLK